jgi:hypothetical protein
MFQNRIVHKIVDFPSQILILKKKEKKIENLSIPKNNISGVEAAKYLVPYLAASTKIIWFSKMLNFLAGKYLFKEENIVKEAIETSGIF